MKTAWKIGVVVLLIVAVVGVLALKQNQGESADQQPEGNGAPTVMTSQKEKETVAPPSQPQALPRLVDLGRETCIPCKMMMPVLAELRKEYVGRLSVEFVNTEKDPGAAAQYGIKLIPTQIFFDASGNELFRHEGFYAKEDILAKWKELGVDLPAAASHRPAPME